MPALPAYATVRPSPGPTVAVALAVAAVIAGAWLVRLASPATGQEVAEGQVREAWLSASEEITEPEILIAGGP